MYVGNQAVDNMYIGSNPVDAVYLGDTQVWSAIPADVKAHIARVLADGGTVPEQAKMVSMVKKLIAANLWNNCVFFGLPLGGVKKDGNQYVGKVYDLKANADLSQATGTAQPKYNSDGSLLYDGGDGLASTTLQNNSLYNVSTNMTFIATCLIKSNAFVKMVVNHHHNTDVNLQPFQIYVNASNKIVVDFRGSNASTMKISLISNLTINNTDTYHIACTFDGGNADVNQRAKLYINGVLNGATATTIGDLTALVKTTYPYSFGYRYSDGSYELPNGSKTALHQIYNSTLSAEQILWNYNNIRPDGV